MKTDKEIVAEARKDWANYYYKVTSYDETNRGDVLEWGAREYVRNLLGLYSCEVCTDWFETEDELCEHLKLKHNYDIIEGSYSHYGEYYPHYVREMKNE